jgi:hypothetical protein
MLADPQRTRRTGLQQPRRQTRRRQCRPPTPANIKRSIIPNCPADRPEAKPARLAHDCPNAVQERSLDKHTNQDGRRCVSNGTAVPVADTLRYRKEPNMKPSTKDQVEGSLHEVKGKVKEAAGRAFEK